MNMETGKIISVSADMENKIATVVLEYKTAEFVKMIVKFLKESIPDILVEIHDKPNRFSLTRKDYEIMDFAVNDFTNAIFDWDTI